MRINLPNQITLARLLLALVFFVVLGLFETQNDARWILVVCFWLFLVAALADILDGCLARWLKQVTPFGRIVDPVVDKVMVCGAFVFFAGHHFVQGDRNITDVAPWMVIVLLVREFLVSAIRSYAEAGGEGFAANWAGKFKMFIQCTTVCVILGQLGWRLDALAPLRTACVWFMLIVTVLSILVYARRAHAFLLSSAALGGTPSAAPGTSAGSCRPSADRPPGGPN